MSDNLGRNGATNMHHNSETAVVNENEEAPTAGRRPGTDERDLSSLVHSAADYLSEHTRRYPYRTLGIAVAIGVVLGGGLPRFAVRMMGRAALRAAGHAILTSEAIVGISRGIFEVATSSAPAASTSTKGPARDEAGRFTS